MSNYYSKICSCCGQYIESDQIKFLKETNQFDAEGNHCSRCYYDIQRDNMDRWRKCFDMIENSLSTELKRFKWRMQPVEEKIQFAHQCMEKGYITWSIGK